MGPEDAIGQSSPSGVIRGAHSCGTLQVGLSSCLGLRDSLRFGTAPSLSLSIPKSFCAFLRINIHNLQRERDREAGNGKVAPGGDDKGISMSS